MSSAYCSPLNRSVPPASPGEFRPLALGQHPIWPPVVLAPMAGVTDTVWKVNQVEARNRAKR